MIKYTLNNNCQAQLLTPINATDTTLVLQTGQGGRMPTSFPFLLVLEKIVGGITTFREIIKITNRTGDILTIVRSAGTCLPNDSSNTPGTTAFDFASGDYVTLAVLSEIVEDIQNELVDLESTKQNNCVMLTKSANYTFTGTEVNNTGFSTTTTSGNITYTLNPALFPITNGMYEFTICKSTNDVNTVIIDVGAGKTIDTVQTYILTNFMESVTIRIASSTFVKVIAATNRTVVVPAISTTQSKFIAGENITAGNALYILPADGKVYKTDASNSSKINFIGFATNTVSTGNNVIVDTSGVSATQSGLTIGSDYYLSNTAGAISTTPGTNVVSVGKAVSATGIEILNSDKYNRNNYISNTFSMNITRVMSSTQNVIYNHSLGKIPKLITLNAFTAVAAGQNASSYGSYDGTNNICTWEQAVNQAVFQSNTLINIQSNTSAGNSGVISNVTSTTFTITWTQLAGGSWGATIYGNVILIA